MASTLAGILISYSSTSQSMVQGSQMFPETPSGDPQHQNYFHNINTLFAFSTLILLSVQWSYPDANVVS